MADLSGYNHVIIFITTHSDPDTGDLWIGEDKRNKPCSAKVSSVSTGLFHHFILILMMYSTVAKHISWAIQAYS